MQNSGHLNPPKESHAHMHHKIKYIFNACNLKVKKGHKIKVLNISKYLLKI